MKSYLKAKNSLNETNFLTISGINVIIKDPIAFSLSVEDLKDVINRMPKHFLSDLDYIIFGKFEFLKKKGYVAAYNDGAIYVNNTQENNREIYDDIIHEIGHSVEEKYRDFVYSDMTLEREFLKKRRILQQQLKMETELEIAEVELQNKKEQLRKLSEEIIPARMTELGMSSTTMVDGSKVDVVENIYVSIPKDPDKSSACFAWLEDNGLGDIIKNQVGMSFGKGENQEANLLEDTIKDLGYIPEVKVSVHPSTLKATVRQLVKDGKSIPDNVFNLFIGQKTKITKKK